MVAEVCLGKVGAVAARKKLLRPRAGRKIAGVCLGMAEYFDLDVTLVRLVWAVVLVVTGFIPAIIAYIVGWVIMPEEPHMLPAPASQDVATVSRPS